ncbi:hypothetical protein K458DRAFT_400115 [Lentithecium fluviatile CBS 122367]|uniref:RING-type domain-containing protein n=1 Tax=Lentithecium fluviatile CBS 122367 TaxID=1168545 RepID=A0A6G1JGJ1_9PLEO|nr:hypothetical protein K458DRAFT_400115 [Lentithecium fluviatile CBS 122367]
MADSNFGGQLHSAFSIAPTPPALQPQEPETLSPAYPNYSSFAASETPAYHQFSNPQRVQLPEPYVGFPYPYLQNRHRQMPVQTGPRAAGYYPPAMSMFQHGPNTAASSITPALHFHTLHMPGGGFADCPEARTLPMMDHAMHDGAPGYSSPPLHHWSSSPFPDFNRLPNTYVPSTPPTPSAIRPVGEGRGPMRRSDVGTPDLPRHMTSPGRRASHDRQFQHNAPTSGGPERRPLSALLGAPTRRPDRSISPRTSNRRSFDRYSTDLSQSSNATETNDANQAPMHRVRRPRTVGFSSSYRARMFANNHDPNVPTQSQMQTLKDKLRHLLPSELPKDTSSMCDICQKDYSPQHTDPSEEAEVAIMLPCKHIFGEHCINTWFNTCKTHKNKVTCPMCRKLLIEPLRPGQEALHSLSLADRRVLERYLMNEDRLHFENAAARELEGDFAHS